MLIGISHSYPSGEFINNFRVVESDLVLHCLPMSHKKDARLIWVKFNTGRNVSLHVRIFGQSQLLLTYISTTTNYLHKQTWLSLIMFYKTQKYWLNYSIFFV